MENDLILRIGNDNYSYLCGLRKSFIVPGAGEAREEEEGDQDQSHSWTLLLMLRVILDGYSNGMKDAAKSPSQQGHWRQVELPGSFYHENKKNKRII